MTANAVTLLWLDALIECQAQDAHWFVLNSNSWALALTFEFESVLKMASFVSE